MISLKIKAAVIVLAVMAASGCKHSKNTPAESPVVRVFDKYLYPGDLDNVIPDNISKSDSTILANDYIDKWVRKQLLLRRAELNLTEDEKNVDEQLENYRSSLLIFKYEQSLIKQKLDTIIDISEIKNYYNDYPANFLLNENLVKALFIKVPKTAPNIWELRLWYRSENEEYLKNLEAYTFKYAEKYEYYNDDWVNFAEIEKDLPHRIDNPQNLLKYRKNYEVKDSSHYYFLNLKDYRLVGSVAPLSYVMEDIRTIIMNKRKIQLINRLESNIYNDALNKDYFTIY
ncbi:MAG: peptidyl-prolyl cis-trans isomerase [Bacteroidales bacterium]